ncbi:lipase 1-like [Bicyclus anynana]|uniref:Lipase n=1 Tax=Bicyclus anynana TaxID=110368 RepID=A0A6J1NNP8_BICAN|nr:lipase 1-like [Bicyclus anynana]
MRTSVSLCLVVTCIQLTNYVSTVKLSEDANLNTTGLATKYGHPATHYDVVTEDGYILTLYRLHGRSGIPVLLTHGLFDSSDTWMIRGNTSLAITLANNGFDVWLANSRGNRYSRRHKTLNPDTDPAFWQFSFHEMGYFDLPAIIDTVLDKTGANSLNAIGHSQGNTMFFVLGSEREEYNSKINVMIALAPVAYLHHSPPPVSFFMQISPTINSLAKLLDIHELLGDNTPEGRLVHSFCPASKVGHKICLYGIVFPMMGFDAAELELDFFATASVHFPAGSSMKCILHYLQVGHRKIFAKYDYGTKLNRKIYNSTNPPAYRLERVTMPIALMAGRNDRFSSLHDVAVLRRQLPNVVYYLENPRTLMNHADYMLGKNLHVYLTPYVLRVLRKRNNFD